MSRDRRPSEAGLRRATERVGVGHFEPFSCLMLLRELVVGILRYARYILMFRGNEHRPELVLRCGVYARSLSLIAGEVTQLNAPRVKFPCNISNMPSLRSSPTHLGSRRHRASPHLKLIAQRVCCNFQLRCGEAPSRHSIWVVQGACYLDLRERQGCSRHTARLDRVNGGRLNIHSLKMCT